MPKVQIMSVIGSAVPTPLREREVLACWYVLRDGEPISGPLTSRPAAQALSRQLNERIMHT